MKKIFFMFFPMFILAAPAVFSEKAFSGAKA